MARSDRRKMIEFIASQLPDGEAVLVLAVGPEGPVSALVEVQGDDLTIATNCPEWVDVREVYDHLRWRAMPLWEQQKWLQAMARPKRATKPTWDSNSGVLSLGDKSWKFRVQVGPTADLLDELHRQHWPRSVKVNGLWPEQVREAARKLRKTRPAIEWTATSDCYLSWRLF